jgi:tRNA-(ms[2]io[6]A)-hydroxylase
MSDVPTSPDISDELPLLCATPRSWAELAAANLPVFLADHAVCEQQAALSALSLIAHYPEDEELVERMTSLAMEEIAHLRRVTAILRQRGFPAARRGQNPYAQALREHMRMERGPEVKLDRLLVCALIEARSCERFTRLLGALDDPELEKLLAELGPAEKRHWELFHRLAARQTSPERLQERWREWLEHEREVCAGLGVAPTVHG